MTIDKKDLSHAVNVLFNPGKYGYKDCENCDGFGDISKNHDLRLIELCKVCGGDGVVPDPDSPNNDGTTLSILEAMGVTVPEA
jgi:DnaJ-class molecular chaperone